MNLLILESESGADYRQYLLVPENRPLEEAEKEVREMIHAISKETGDEFSFDELYPRLQDAGYVIPEEVRVSNYQWDTTTDTNSQR